MVRVVDASVIIAVTFLLMPAPAPLSPLEVLGVDLPLFSEGFRRSRGE